MPAIKRCLPKSPYLRSSDDRIMEYKWDKLLFSERSPYQLVEIFSTLDFGNCLVLDGFINLAESDLVYTHNLMCHGKQDYKVSIHPQLLQPTHDQYQGRKVLPILIKGLQR